jgi:hypothetical protein
MRPLECEYCDGDYVLIDDGTLDTVLRCGSCGVIVRFDPDYAAPFRDEGGTLDLKAFVKTYRADIGGFVDLETFRRIAPALLKEG